MRLSCCKNHAPKATPKKSWYKLGKREVPLTETEKKSLALIKKGYSWIEISDKLNLSYGYLRTIGWSLRKKLGYGLKEIQTRASST